MTSPDDSDRKRRRFSLWTLLAPIALIAFVVAVFQAVGQFSAERGASTTADPAPASTVVVPKQAMYKVKSGESWSTVAEKFGFTSQELAACNPQIGDITNVPVGQRVRVKCPQADG